jgi:hypothetical protein
VGRKKTIPGRWRQVADRAEVVRNVAFFHSFNHRKTTAVVYNRYAEHMFPQTWWYASGKLFEYIL